MERPIAASKDLISELNRIGKQLNLDPSIFSVDKLEQALRYSEARFKLIFNNAVVGIAVVDSNGRFIDANQTWLDMLGYTLSELQELGVRDVSVAAEEVIDPRTHQSAGQYIQVEKRYRRKDGTEFWGNLCVGKIEDPDGKIVGMVGVIIDITERKEAVQHLQENEVKLDALYESMAQGVVYQNQSGEIIEANPAAQTILGLSLDQMQGRTSTDPRWRAIKEDGTDFDGDAHPAMVALKTGKPVRDVIMGVFNPQDEELRWLNVNAIPQFREEETAPYQVFTTFCDMTDRFRVESEVRNRLAFEQAYVNISSRFIKDLDMDLAINATLADIGELCGADRAYLFQFFIGGKRMDNTHEWCADSVSAEKENLQRLQTADFPWLISQLNMGDPLLIDDIDHLPTAAAALQSNLQAQNVQALIALPVYAAGQLAGFLGIDFLSGKEKWDERDQTLLRITAEIIGHALERKQNRDTLQRAYDWQEAIFEGSRDAIMISDERGQIIAVNQAASKITGHSIEALTNIPLSSLHDEDGFGTFFSIQKRVLAGEEITSQAVVKQPDGGEIATEFSSRRIIIDGTPYMHTVARDISRRTRTEETLRQTETRLHTILNNAPLVLWSVDEAGEFVLSVGKGLESLGLAPGEVVGRSVYEVYKDYPAIIQDVEKALKGIIHTTVQEVNGIYYETRFAPLMDDNSTPEGCIGISVDITERKKIENQLTYLATHDVLTGLPNRMAFNDRLSLALSLARRNQDQLAIFLLDLDNFKEVNDSLGHDSGDKLLKIAGERLREVTRKNDLVARIGGDEFMIMISDLNAIKDTKIIAEKILGAFRKPFKFNDHEFTITTSMGISIFPNDGDTSEDLKKHADIAMYRAKDLGRDKFEYFRKGTV